MIIKSKIEYGNHSHREVAHIEGTKIPVWLVVRLRMLYGSRRTIFGHLAHRDKNGVLNISEWDIDHALFYYGQHQHEIETDLWYEVFQYLEPRGE